MILRSISPIVFVWLLIIQSTSVQGQDVTNSRQAMLMNGNYNITGSAFLEKLSDGALRLRLSEDYSTPGGPDVQIFLGNDPENVSGALFVEDIGTSGGTNHFSGAKSFDLGTTVGIEEYDYVVFRCVAFGLHWANGNFGATEGGGNNQNDDCIETIAATTNWITEVSICPSDGEDDIIPLLNTQGIEAGNTYAYILTDLENKIIKLHFNGTYNFEGSGSESIRVYGISYSGTLSYNVGDDISAITSTGCAILSDLNTFLTVTKDNCPDEPICFASIVATTNWISELSVCPNDGIADVTPLLNNQFVSPGDKYAYVFADASQNIRFLHFEDAYDFEASGNLTEYIYGVSYEGTLSYNVGDPITSITADGCAILSDTETFLTVRKDACIFECIETLTATTNWVTEVNICPTDGLADEIELLNNELVEAGDHYAFVVTDESDLIQFIHNTNSYNFEGAGLTNFRVYGISYEGTLTYNVGDPISSITSDGCAILSSLETFLTIRKDACAYECIETSTSTSDGTTEVNICPTDGLADEIELLNSAQIETGEHYTFIVTDESDNIQFSHGSNSYNFEGSGSANARVYGVSYDRQLSFNIGDPISSINAEGCVVLSSSESFLTVKKEACVGETGSISGKVTTADGRGIANVKITLNTGAFQMTIDDGTFSFSDLPLGQPYTLTPTRSDQSANGVSAQDMVIILRHVLGIQTFTSPYQVISADANGDQKVSAIDLINMQNVILGKTLSFPNELNWRFVAADETFPNATNPFPIIEKDAIQNLTGDVGDLDFIGMKTGDVSGNVKVN